MRGLNNTTRIFLSVIAQDAKAAVYRHFGNHIGGSVSGLFIRIPFSRLSTFIEHSRVPVGFGYERIDGGLELFAGRIRAVVCIEPKTAR